MSAGAGFGEDREQGIPGRFEHLLDVGPALDEAHVEPEAFLPNSRTAMDSRPAGLALGYVISRAPSFLPVGPTRTRREPWRMGQRWFAESMRAAKGLRTLTVTR